MPLLSLMSVMVTASGSLTPAFCPVSLSRFIRAYYPGNGRVRAYYPGPAILPLCRGSELHNIPRRSVIGLLDDAIVFLVLLVFISSLYRTRQAAEESRLAHRD